MATPRAGEPQPAQEWYPELTPYAKKYGLSNVDFYRLNGQSGLTPTSPIQQSDFIDKTGFVNKRDLAEARKRYIGKAQKDSYQRQRIVFSTRELILAGAHVPPPPEGQPHDEDINMDNLDFVHPLFARENWISSLPEHRAFYPMQNGMGQWNAHEDICWEILQPILQLASRLITQGHHLYWFDALIHSPRERCTERNFKTPLYRIRRREPEYVDYDSVRQFFELLTGMVNFCFFSAYNGDIHFDMQKRVDNYNEMPDGITECGEPFRWHNPSPTGAKIMVALTVELLEPLNSPYCTEADRTIIQFYAADAILHELAHAANAALAQGRVSVGYPLDFYKEQHSFGGEIYFEDEVVCEPGFSLCNAIWGARSNLSSLRHVAFKDRSPSLAARKWEYHYAFPMSLNFRTYPTASEAYGENPPLDSDDAINNIIQNVVPAPIKELEGFQTKSFWNEFMPAFGSIPTDFRGLYARRKFTPPQYSTVFLGDTDHMIQIDSDDDELQDMDAAAYFAVTGNRQQTAETVNAYRKRQQKRANAKLRLQRRKTQAGLIVEDLRQYMAKQEALKNNYNLNDDDYLRPRGDVDRSHVLEDLMNMQEPRGFKEMLALIEKHRNAVELDTMTEWAPAVVFLDYLNRAEGQRILPWIFYPFLEYCQKIEQYFEFTPRGTGEVRFRKEGWGPAPPRPPREVVKEPEIPPDAGHIWLLIMRSMEKTLWQYSETMHARHMDMDFETINRLTERVTSRAYPDYQWDKETFRDVMRFWRANGWFFTYGPSENIYRKVEKGWFTKINPPPKIGTELELPEGSVDDSSSSGDESDDDAHRKIKRALRDLQITKRNARTNCGRPGYQQHLNQKQLKREELERWTANELQNRPPGAPMQIPPPPVQVTVPMDNPPQHILTPQGVPVEVTAWFDYLYKAQADKGKGKGKAKADDDDDDEEEVATTTTSTNLGRFSPTKGKGKGRATYYGDDDDEDVFGTSNFTRTINEGGDEIMLDDGIYEFMENLEANAGPVVREAPAYGVAGPSNYAGPSTSAGPRSPGNVQYEVTPPAQYENSPQVSTGSRGRRSGGRSPGGSKVGVGLRGPRPAGPRLMPASNYTLRPRTSPEGSPPPLGTRIKREFNKMRGKERVPSSGSKKSVLSAMRNFSQGSLGGRRQYDVIVKQKAKELVAGPKAWIKKLKKPKDPGPGAPQ